MADLTDKIFRHPGTIATPAIAPLYVDGLPLDDAQTGWPRSAERARPAGGRISASGPARLGC
jgi:hypothetical protein